MARLPLCGVSSIDASVVDNAPGQAKGERLACGGLAQITMPFSQVPMTLRQKLALWAAVLLLVVAAPSPGVLGSFSGARGPSGLGQPRVSVGANAALAVSHLAAARNNSEHSGSRVTSSQAPGANTAFATDEAPLSGAVFGAGLAFPSAPRVVVAELQAFAPQLPASSGCKELQRARAPPVTGFLAV